MVKGLGLSHMFWVKYMKLGSGNISESIATAYSPTNVISSQLGSIQTRLLGGYHQFDVFMYQPYWYKFVLLGGLLVNSNEDSLLYSLVITRHLGDNCYEEASPVIRQCVLNSLDKDGDVMQ